MNATNKTIMLYVTRRLFVLLAFAISAYSQVSSKPVVGETVAQFAAKVGVNTNACHKKAKLHTFVCTAVVNAEQGYRVTIEKEGKWSAVLDGGKLVSYEVRTSVPPDDLKPFHRQE